MDEMGVRDKSLYMLLTRNCNLHCEYCFQRESHKLFPSKVNDKNFEKFLNYLATHTIGHVTVLGGEAWLEPNHIKALLYVCKEHGIQVGFITNGTIYLPWLKDYKDIITNVQVSVDGYGKAHDRYRSFAPGRGSFDIVVKNIKQLVEDGLSVSMHGVATIETYRRILAELELLLDAVPAKVEFGLTIADADMYKTWASLKIVHAIYKKWRQMKPEYRDRFLLPLSTDQHGSFVCIAGSTFFGYDNHSGTFTSCHQYMGDPNHAVGSIHNEEVIEPAKLACLGNVHDLSRYRVWKFGKFLSTFILTYLPVNICWCHNAKYRPNDPYQVSLVDVYLAWCRSRNKYRSGRIKTVSKDKMMQAILKGTNSGIKIARRKRIIQKLWTFAQSMKKESKECTADCWDYCCQGCEYLGETGCKTKCLVCSLYYCDKGLSGFSKRNKRKLMKYLKMALTMGCEARVPDRELT